MVYDLTITEHANELLDRLVNYLIFQKCNSDAAFHLLNEIDEIYVRLKENPYQFVKCKDPVLEAKEYRVAYLTTMNYLLIFKVRGNVVEILGFFHGLERYWIKL